MKRYRLSASMLLILIISTCFSGAAAQQVDESFVLDNNQTGTSKEYIARDYIRLTPGFCFSASQGSTFKGSVDPCLLFPPTENTYALPDGTFTGDPLLGGAVVGSIPGQFAVSPTGAATYTIPIECPTGINGMQPTIALVYNSQSGNGIAGWGWNLSGLSSISVVPKTIFSNNEVKSLNVAEQLQSQTLALDGNRLILKSNVGTVKQYVTENKTYVKIIHDGSKFVVTTKEGVVTEYARQCIPQKVETSQTTPGPYIWLITKVTDSNGNYVSYHYKTNNNNTQTVLDKVEYTGNGSILPSLMVKFEYIEKAEVKKQYVGGYYFEDVYLLKNIIVKNINHTLREYEFTHIQPGDKKLLSAVNLYNGNDEKVNATTIEWGADNEVIHVNTINPSLYFGDVTYRLFYSGDVDGDGISDIIEYYRLNALSQLSHNVKVHKMKFENGNFVYDQTILNKTLPELDYKNWTVVNSMGPLAGFNGSQKKTVLIPCIEDGPGGVSCDLFDVKSSINLNCPLDHTSCTPEFVIGDINNDGIDEIIYIERTNNDNPATPDYQNGRIIYIKKKNLLTEALTLQDSLIDEPLSFDSRIPGTNTHPEIKEVFLSDFNADGLQDLMICTSAGSFYMKNNGGATGADGVVRVEFSQLPGIVTSLAMSDKYSSIKGGDFNGDGMLDFLLYDGNSDFSLHLNNGNFGFTEDQVANLELIEDNYAAAISGNKINDDKDDFIITDFNQDGKSDLIVIDINCKYSFPNTVYDNTTIKWYKSEGSSFTLTKSLTLEDQDYYYKGHSASGDFNGDGREDLFSYGSNIYTGNSASENEYIYSSFNTNFEANQIKSISKGLGDKISIHYQPLTFTQHDGQNFYVKDIFPAYNYPIVDLQIPIYCVRNVLDTTGTINNFYSYAKARMHVQGKGFLGFSEQTVKDLRNNTKTVLINEMNYDYCLPTKQTNKTIMSDNVLAAKTETVYENSVSEGVYTSLPKTITETDNLTGLSKTTEYWAYDDEGNLQMSKIKTNNDETFSIQYFTYGQFGHWSWGDNKLLTATEVKSIEEYSTQSTEYTYDTNSGRLTSETINPDNPLYIKTEYYAYDNFGHPTIIRTKAKDKDGVERTREITQHYTSSGRFLHDKTNVLGETTTYNWNEINGSLTSETDHWGRTTSYFYDNWGKLKETHYSDGNRKTQVLQWAGSGGPTGAVYYSYDQTSGTAPVTTWYDVLGREIQKDSYGLNNRKISVYTEYYSTGTNNGKLYRVSEPCFEEGDPVWAATYAYDTYGRPSTVITPAGTTSYTYDGLTTIITSPGDTVSTTLNSTGLAQSITTNGKTVSYTYYSTGAVKTATPQGGQPISMEYDIQGNRTKLTDPDAGVIESFYNGFGELVWTKQNVHHRADSVHLSSDTVLVTHNYAPTTGLLQSIVRTGKSTETTLYTYDPVHKSRVVGIEIPGQHKQSFSYDDHGRVTNVREEVGTKVFERSTEYNAFGRPRKEIYPSGYYVLNTYDENGYLTRVDDQDSRLVWEALTENARGQILTEKKGTKTTTYAYDSRGLPSSIQAPGIVNLSYAFTNEGNLLYREDSLNYQKEVFAYDELNRLTGWNIYDDSSIPNEEHSIVYHPTTGNIESKTDLRIDMEPCTLSYNADGKPHALAAVSNAPDYISAENLTVTYTDFRKINTLTEGNKTYTLTYGVDDQRRKSVFTQGAATTTRYYLGDYEEVQKSDGTIQKIHYLRGGSMMLQQGATKSLYYGYHDYQGSLIAWTNQSGTVVERRAYDPWGRHRNPQSWTEVDYTSTSWLNNRGYTGHEHLDAFQIINMNGRVYDPLTAQFFSPDPFVQAPDNWLNYNRYGYCLNNPLIYTDPDGELVWWAIAAIIYGVFFTEPGYQLQKYISPIAYKVELDFGSHQSGIGIKGGVGVPKVASIFGANANWYEGSAKYYWKDYGDYKGWEFTYGKETTKWGVITEGNTNVIKKNGVKDYSQSVGYKKYGIPGLLAVEHYNDAWGNDVSDKYNTATSKIIVGPFSLENVIFTGEPKIGQDGEYKKTEKTGIFGNKYSVYDEEEDSPRHGILALRIGSFRIGGDSERIRATIQNGYHTILGDPYFQYKPYTPRWFFQFGW